MPMHHTCASQQHSAASSANQRSLPASSPTPQEHPTRLTRCPQRPICRATAPPASPAPAAAAGPASASFPSPPGRLLVAQGDTLDLWQLAEAAAPRPNYGPPPQHYHRGQVRGLTDTGFHTQNVESSLILRPSPLPPCCLAGCSSLCNPHHMVRPRRRATLPTSPAPLHLVKRPSVSAIPVHLCSSAHTTARWLRCPLHLNPRSTTNYGPTHCSIFPLPHCPTCSSRPRLPCTHG